MNRAGRSPRTIKSGLPLLATLVLLAAAGILAWFFFDRTAAGQLLEARSLDLRFKIRGAVKPEKEIVLVTVDERTFDRLALKYPFPPKIFASLIERLNEDGAAVIGFDFLYSEPSRECDPPGQDLLLSEAMRENANVVWALQLEEDCTPRYPIDVIRDAAAGCGYINLPDERDGRIRKTVPSRNGVDSFAAAVVRQYAGFVPERWKGPEPVRINFRGPAGTYRSFSMGDVLAGEIPKNEFEGKICLVGATFAASHDLYQTVFHNPSLPDTPGIEIHANIAGGILRGDVIRTGSSALCWAVFLVLILMVETLICLDHPWMAIAAWALSSAGWFLYSILRFLSCEAVLLVSPLAVLAATFLAGAFINYLKEREKKREIRELFSSYVDPSVVSWLLKNPEAVNFEGERRTLTVLYTDIEGFTAITESMDPVQLVRQLNVYFETLTGIGISEGGMHDKFVGDAIMMVFGFPKYEDSHALKAVMAAKQMLQGVDRLNRSWEREGITPLKTRIGICSGEVVIGNVGGARMKAFTVMGDAPNLASRLEGLNKRFGTHILISESTAKLLPETIPLRDLGEIVIRGYSKRVKVFNPSFDVPPAVQPAPKGADGELINN